MYLLPRVTFDLLIPNVDRFTCLTDHLCSFASKPVWVNIDYIGPVGHEAGS